MFRFLILASSTILLATIGCSKPSRPTMAGGKSVDAWVEALQSPVPAERKKAAAELGNVGDTNPAVVPALRKALPDTDPSVRLQVIMAIVKCRKQGLECVPALAEMKQNDPDPRVREYARQAVETLQAKP